jgi:hypothetical protein
MQSSVTSHDATHQAAGHFTVGIAEAARPETPLASHRQDLKARPVPRSWQRQRTHPPPKPEAGRYFHRLSGIIDIVGG